MSLIMRTGEKKANTNKQAYTWAACVLVSVFLITAAIPLLNSKKEKSGQDYQERAFDLAQLPFATDEAADALLQTDKYQDIGKKDLIGSLFSKEDKEKRQAEDAKEGTPAAPDEDYKAAEVQKANAAAAEERRTQYASAGRTSQGALRGGSMASASGSSGIRGNIWRSDDKDYSGSESGSSSSGRGNMTADQKAQLLAGIKGGRSTGFVDAYAQSAAAAKNKDKDSAAAGAIDAFQKGAQGQKDDKTDLDKKAEELALDPEALKNKLEKNSLPSLNDSVKTKLDQKKDEQTKEKCKMMFESWDCAMSQIATMAFNMVAGAGQSALTAKWGGVQAAANNNTAVKPATTTGGTGH